MEVLALTSSLESNLNVVNVTSSALSQTIAARTRQYTLECCETCSVMRKMAERDRVQAAFEGAKHITCEY
jgi:hypothetical protein